VLHSYTSNCSLSLTLVILLVSLTSPKRSIDVGDTEQPTITETVSAIMIVGDTLAISTLDNANTLFSHDLVTKLKNIVKSVKDKVTTGGHSFLSGG
jgi:hypothetical protein